ncbi:hypothetical protein AKJ09_08475 [Labilithrix luteola]|uniref:Lipoprotein n=1 Tax=Labilithrix luteola TaxID=1391654 RepID=A0A0K1Q834_9BACT|nr:hypothetical protein [Labilithrix luteola]AKV01812.1 hypothetical protein AKJ09_08475 [Labilithrix luteola]
MARRVALFGLSLVSLLAACQLVAGIERVDKSTTGPTVTDVPDASAPTEAGPIDPCVHARLPDTPSVDDDAAFELPTIVMAMERFSLKDNPDGHPGVDLDNVCTCDTRPDTAHDGASSCVRKGKPACDGDGGVDNFFGDSVATFQVGFDIDDFAGVNEGISRGRQSALLFVRKYNGRANDRDVEVGFVASDGIRDQGCPQSVPEGTGRGWYTPGWCGTDAWSVLPGTIVNGFPVAYGPGHVTDYSLVVELDLSVGVPFGDIVLAMGSPVSVGKLVPLDKDMKPRDPNVPATPEEQTLWRLDDGIIAGRVAATDMLSAAGAAFSPTGIGQDGTRVCQNPLFFSYIKGRICDSLDIAKSAKLDFQPDYACDAVSMMIRYSCAPARVGGEYKTDLTANPCVAVDGGPREPQPGVSYRCD